MQAGRSHGSLKMVGNSAGGILVRRAESSSHAAECRAQHGCRSRAPASRRVCARVLATCCDILLIAGVDRAAIQTVFESNAEEALQLLLLEEDKRAADAVRGLIESTCELINS